MKVTIKKSMLKEAVKNLLKQERVKTFYRLQSKQGRDALHNAFGNLRSIYESMKNGNDLNMTVLQSVIKQLNEVKASVDVYDKSVGISHPIKRDKNTI